MARLITLAVIVTAASQRYIRDKCITYGEDGPKFYDRHANADTDYL